MMPKFRPAGSAIQRSVGINLVHERRQQQHLPDALGPEIEKFEWVAVNGKKANKAGSGTKQDELGVALGKRLWAAGDIIFTHCGSRRRDSMVGLSRERSEPDFYSEIEGRGPRHAADVTLPVGRKIAL
jgi:hypothetical protein